MDFMLILSVVFFLFAIPLLVLEIKKGIVASYKLIKDKNYSESLNPIGFTLFFIIFLAVLINLIIGFVQRNY